MNPDTAIRSYPEHVPPELYWDRDIDEFVAEFVDPYEAAARLHEGPDIIWAKGGYRGVGGWLLTRYDDIEAAYLDSEHFSVRDHFYSVFSEVLGVPWVFTPQAIDPPRHMGFRQVVQPFFQPAAVRRMENNVREICRSLIADLKGRKSFDYIEDFGRFFPTNIFLDLLDLPRENLGQFLEWEATMIRGETNEIRRGAMRAIVDYLEDRVEERRHNPGDDIISRVISAKVNGQPMEHDDVMGMVSLLYAAGLDTVLGSLGWHMYRLASEPHLQDEIRNNPSNIMNVVDELCRAYGVVRNRRTVTKDFEFRGVKMKAGDWVNLPTMLGSRDARKYPDPNKIDFNRKDRGMTFGGGIHYCLGIHLARLEMKVVLEEVLAAFPNIRIAPGKEVTWHTVGVWGVDSLPLVWGDE